MDWPNSFLLNPDWLNPEVYDFQLIFSKYLPISTLSKFAILLVLFAGPDLGCVWCDAFKNLGERILEDSPVLGWKSALEVTIFLSVVEESNNRSKNFLFDSLNIFWVTGSFEHLSMFQFTWNFLR